MTYLDIYVTDDLVLVDVCATERYMLQELPKYITNGKNEKRKLCAVIRYIGTLRKGVGHYTAVCQRSNGKWEEFDSIAKKGSIRKITDHRIIPAILIYKT